MALRLKSFLPRGLFGRAALILVLPIVVLQLVVAATFIQRHFEGVTRQMSEGVAIEIRYLLAEVAAAPDLATAQARADDLGRALDLTVVLPGGPPLAADERAFWDWSGRAVIQTLRSRLPEMEVADLLVNQRAMRVWFSTPFGDLRIEMDRRRVSASNPHQLLVLMVFASVVMTGVAFVFLRNQMTPIARLAKAAEAFGKGQVVPYRPRGALEVRAAGNAFLDMRARIERQIETRTMMLSGVSHDLRTPLTRMKLALSLMPEDDETEALSRDVAQMERMVNAFLAFARGDAMEEAVPVDPSALLAAVAEAAVRAGQPVTLGAMDWPPPGRPAQLRLRPDALNRALENLIGNAVRHGNRVEASLVTGERMLRFVIEDDGPGIPREQRDEAVQPFRRLDSARNPNSGGVGLGLAIAADVARSHGGALRLGESERLGGLRAELSVAR